MRRATECAPYHLNVISTRIANVAFAAFVCLAANFAFAGAQEPTIEIVKPANFLGLTPPTPIAIVGFTGEAASVLNFDLTVMGFTNVPESAANYILSGSAGGGSVRGKLEFSGMAKSVVPTGASPANVKTSSTRTVLFSKQYQGSTIRAQAHMLADDVVLKITGVIGIAEVKGEVSRIAFKADLGKTSEIYIADFDGHDAVPATADGSITAAPAWRPGHYGIYYTSYKLGNPQVFYQNVGTGKRDKFAHYPGMNSSAAPSPDGSKVALILSKGGSPDLYVCDADGGNLKQLTNTREDESSPCWSPDGKWICYASKSNERRALSKISANGGAPELIRTGVANPSEPDWSPDGRWIIFTAQMGNFEICVVPAQGGTATPLVSGEDPCWAPNSRTVIFVRRNGGNRALSLLDVPTKQTKDVSRVTGSNSQPSWAK